MTTPTRIYKDLDFSMALTTTFDVAKRFDVNSVKQSIKNLLLTRPKERVFQPQVGSELYRILFEPMDVLTVEALKSIISTCIKTYEPRVKLQEVAVNPNYDNNSYDISLYFYVIGVYTPVTFNLTLTRIR
jgi:phage baseplate assembly protein W